ncbi:xanthine dehydrogenase family protein molybdopterin-binding subunit [bacterium]|nr:xanthine dehydrogenase family protein molybdopterin-binding subunit [bacterium]
MMNKKISRRKFLKSSLAATGLTIVAYVTPFGTRLVNASGTEGASLKPSPLFEVTPDNKVKFLFPNSEMGQGSMTGHTMILADELEADWDQMEVKHAPAAKAFGNPIMGGTQITVASAATRGWYAPLRKMGAAGRTMLVEAAAKKWNVPASQCKAIKGTVVNLKNGSKFTYGQLCLDAAKLEIPEDPVLKKESEFRYMGKYMPRLDIPEKVSGKAVFGYDVELPDLHYAVLARPPAYGAKHQSFDAAAAMAVKDVAKVLPTPNGIAVCAKTFEAAVKGRDALKVKWGPGSHPDMNTASIEKRLIADLDKPGANAVTRGDVKQSLSQAYSKYEATYYIPCVAHATMEPMNFTADVRKDGCDVYGPTQGQTLTHGVASKITGLPMDKVNVHTTYLGCGLGRRAMPDFVIDALISSKALGKPVKAVWTREEDIQHDFFRSAMAHRIQAGLDNQGRLITWDHKLSSFSLSKYAGAPPKDGLDWYCLWGLWDKRPGPPIFSRMTYEIPNFSVNLVLSDLPVPVRPWRSVQNAVNAFATECFMDELAHKAGKDPFTFRLESLKDNMRAQRVLESVALNSNWGKSMPKGRGIGIAQHHCFGTYIAQVAEVSVGKDGTVRVHRVDCAVDCGPAVNPDQIAAQIEGAVTLALSTTLKEEVEFENGGVKSANFDDYNILRISETPEINVYIVESNEPIGGIGEPGVTPVAPAIANAVFNATGARVRRIPLTPERVLAAMKA